MPVSSMVHIIGIIRPAQKKTIKEQYHDFIESGSLQMFT